MHFYEQQRFIQGVFNRLIYEIVSDPDKYYADLRRQSRVKTNLTCIALGLPILRNSDYWAKIRETNEMKYIGEAYVWCIKRLNEMQNETEIDELGNKVQKYQTESIFLNIRYQRGLDLRREILGDIKKYWSKPKVLRWLGVKLTDKQKMVLDYDEA